MISNVLQLSSQMAKKQIKIPSVTGFRPTLEDMKLLGELKAKTGLGAASVIRLALRRLAELELKVA